MVLINKAINEVTLKLVYYGPGLCGKTTNLEQIYGNPKLENKGKMISMSTETDRTLFFDFMPMELGTIGGQKIRVQLYTVPGQVFYDATRKLVLRGADGVVFVADSQASMRESNLESLENLRTNLRINRLDPDKVAIVFQYNKRDLPGVSSVEEMNAYMNPDGRIPVVEAAAKNGIGVAQTLRAAVARILDNLKNNVDVTLYDAPPLQRPSMSAPSGATSASAGVPKISIAALAAEKAARPAPQRTAPSTPSPVAAAAAAAPSESPKRPTFDFTEIPDDEETHLEEDPFGQTVEAEIAAAPDFASSLEEPMPPEVDFDAFEAPAATDIAVLEAPLSVEVDAESGAPEAIAVPTNEEGVEALLNAADEAIRHLESALDAARRQRDALRMMFGR